VSFPPTLQRRLLASAFPAHLPGRYTTFLKESLIHNFRLYLAAKRDCAVSKALAGVEEIGLEAKLVEHAG
jgi:hypothetical protein